uniref:hypothetical protein n=1 Tax=Yoonia sp. TaxID=2212373 RepID=UPI00404741A7
MSHPLVPAPTTGDWMQDRLTEARGVLADTTQHPDSLIILAARVVIGQTGDVSECADAIDLLRLLDQRPLHVIAAAAFPKGGAA